MPSTLFPSSEVFILMIQDLFEGIEITEENGIMFEIRVAR